MKERGILEKWLPKETIRIEDDLDIVSTPTSEIEENATNVSPLFSCSFLYAEKVTYLPPIGVSVGDKLWFAKDKAYILPRNSIPQKYDWADHVWLNLRLFETILNRANAHRIKSYVNKLEQLFEV